MLQKRHIEHHAPPRPSGDAPHQYRATSALRATWASTAILLPDADYQQIAVWLQ